MCFCLASVLAVEAHEPGLSALEITSGARLRAHLTFSKVDIDTLLSDGSDLEQLAGRSLTVRRDGDILLPRAISAWRDASEAARFELEFDATSATSVEVESRLLAELPRGHRQLAVIRDTSGTRRVERLLDARRSAFSFTPSRSPFTLSWSYVALGVEHIVTGYDHVLFLIALLVAGTGFWNVAKVVTAFTVAHSVTLVLAAFEIVQLPATVVEPLIAASIVYVALENLLRRDHAHRWAVVFSFGLIHGLGFAFALSELTSNAQGGAGTVISLLAFNAGVELGQIAIMLVVFPMLWSMRRSASLKRWLPILGSSMVLLAGLYWLVERTVIG